MVAFVPTMKPLKDGNAGNDVVKNTPETASNDGKAEPEKIDFSKVEIEPLFKDFVDFETFSKSISEQSRCLPAKPCRSPRSF